MNLRCKCGYIEQPKKRTLYLQRLTIEPCFLLNEKSSEDDRVRDLKISILAKDCLKTARHQGRQPGSRSCLSLINSFRAYMPREDPFLPWHYSWKTRQSLTPVSPGWKSVSRIVRMLFFRMMRSTVAKVRLLSGTRSFLDKCWQLHD